MDTRGMRQEYLARWIVLILTAAVLAGLVFGFQNYSADVVLSGRIPEDGGWQPGNLKVKAGEPLRLRLTSHDVVHGFAIGQMEGTEVEILPGKFTDYEITFDTPGTYTFYCTRWCGPNHWRMRGTIEVEGENENQKVSDTIPLYIQLGIDIDAEHKSDILPEVKPSAEKGRTIADYLPGKYREADYFIAYSPSKIFKELRSESALVDLQDQQLWDLIAYLYWVNSSKEELELGQHLYNENCAACHGENGRGDGVFAQHGGDHQTKTADFSESHQMLGASSALLHGKIIRGGMGTGMPYWGPILTEEQTWSIIQYLWSFQFDYSYELRSLDGQKEK